MLCSTLSAQHEPFGRRCYDQRYSSDSPKGMDDKPSSHRQPRLSSTSHARPASMQLPSVQKASSQMSHTPLPLVGMNSMYRVKDTGTPPRPNPTQNRKKMSHCTRDVVHQYLFSSASTACVCGSQCFVQNRKFACLQGQFNT